MSAALLITAKATTLTTATLASNKIPLLARSDSPGLGRMIVPLAVILVLAAMLLAVLSVVRRRMRMTDDPGITRGFSLGDLRDLHRQGKISTEEFDRAKALLVSSVHSGLKKEAKATNAEPLNTEPK